MKKEEAIFLIKVSLLASVLTVLYKLLFICV